MPALNYQERFASKVERGAKRHTIRRRRKREIKPGDTLYHYTGLRTKKCRKLAETICENVWSARITNTGIAVNGEWLIGLHMFAYLDGFNSWAEMRDFFKKRYGLPFEGVLITW